MNWTIFTIGACLIVGYFLGRYWWYCHIERLEINAAIVRRLREIREGKV